MNLVPNLRLFCLAAFFAALTLVSAAQSVTEAAKIAAVLQPASRAVLDRLSALRELPDGAWKIHPGDVSHAEAVGLDESSWKPIASGEKAPNEAVWFRQTYRVPDALNGYDLTGARIWFQFHAYANGPMPQILYFNGRRVAMGDDLEPVVLLDGAKPGDTVVVAVKLLHTVDTKNFQGATLKIDFPEGRPNPEDLRQEFLSAALLVPALAKGDAAKMAVLDGAVQTVDLTALDAKNQKRFDLSLKAAHTKLEALTPLLQTVTYHLTGNSHIDAAWLWPWTETVDVVKRTFGTALQLMYEYPQYTYTQSAAAYNEWIADKYPDMNAEIKQRIKEGRWEIVGGMWVEPDLNMPDGESLVRQILVGKRWFKNAYGVDTRIGWNPDSFGYTWQLPQIYKKSGIDYFVTQKMAWCDTNQLPFKFFWWQSPDGSKVLSYFPHDYANDNLNPVRLARDFTIAQKQATGLPTMMDLYGIGDHGGGPTRAILDEGFHWASQSTSATAANIATATSTGTNAGAQSTTANTTGTNANAQSTTANSTGFVTGHDLSRAENADKKDGALAPAMASESHVMPKIEFGTAQTYFSSLEKQIAPASPVWDYKTIAKGYSAPPAVEGKVSIPTWKSELYFEYHRGVMTTQANHKRNMRDAEEEVLNAEKFSSLAWVLAGRAYPGAELTEDWKKVLFNQFHDLAAGSGIGQIYKDAQKDYDVVRWSTNEIDAGALQAVVENIDTQTTEAGSIKIAVFNALGWPRSGDVTVMVQFPKIKPENVVVKDAATHKIIFESGEPLIYDSNGIVELKLHVESVPAFGYKILSVSQEKTGDSFTLSGIQSETQSGKMTIQNEALRISVDTETGCITSIHDIRTGYESLVPGACGNELQAFKDTPKDYDAWNIDPGTLDQKPALLHEKIAVNMDASSGDDVIRVRRRWQRSDFVQTIRLLGDQIDIDNEIDWHESHVLLKAAFPLAVSSDHATYEIPYGAINRATTRNNSWEKAQFEVPAMRWADISGAGADGKVHGLSVINNSKYGYDAVGNVLRISLLRSPKWPDAEADMGHHHFHYALYPHAGDWKDALTVRHGYEYNYPLTAVVTTAHAGSLPPSHSFASVTPENVVLTAVKKAEDQNGLGVNGLILRIYEWAGKDSTAEFHVPAGATSATVTNLMETPEGQPLAVTHDGASGGEIVRAPIHPYEILTLRVDYPAAGPKQN